MLIQGRFSIGRQVIAADSAARNRKKGAKARHLFDGTTHNHQQRSGH